MNKTAPATNGRKAYTEPKFERYGNIGDLTQAVNSHGALDGGINKTNKTH